VAIPTSHGEVRVCVILLIWSRVGPWTHRIQWENNGQVYSLLSTGTQYRLPAQTRRRAQNGDTSFLVLFFYTEILEGI
uniref:Uncharacterized protein n=1 Tax=Maylandia zebra TaxID=106582 RepID=A0A3P9B3Y4_9CICH